MTVLLVDNYDSFTHNVAHSLAANDARVEVRRNDAITIEDVQTMNPSAIVLGPGPGHPACARDFGVGAAILQEMPHTPILGICMGMQGMAHHDGIPVQPAPTIVHGETVNFQRDDHPVFADLPRTLQVGRYHSLAVDAQQLTPQWQALGTSEDKVLMAMAHRGMPRVGLQFHPESILTPHGDRMVQNFLHFAHAHRREATA